MGGPERVEKYMHSRGKLDVRQRISRLFDPGTFREIGSLVGTMEDIPSDGFVAGYGRIDGRTVLAGAEDFTVLGGSIGAGNTAKRYRVAELAAQEGLPLVTMLEGAGHRLTDTGGSRAPGDLQAYADLNGQVPMVCLVMGASAGHGALAAPLSDFVIMTSYASMFTGGPPLVKAATGEDVTKEELGGADVCTRIAGSAHNEAPDDEAAIDMARLYLSYFPSRAGQPSPLSSGPDTEPRVVEELLDIIPPNDRRPYDMHDVIDLIADPDSFFEIQPAYGPAIIVGLARFGGRPTMIVANNPAYLAGSVDAAAAIKATDFLEVIANYDHPVVFLADNPGVMAGTKAEQEGILKWGGKMYKAERRLTNPKIEITHAQGVRLRIGGDGPEPVRQPDPVVLFAQREHGGHARRRRGALSQARRRNPGPSGARPALRPLPPGQPPGQRRRDRPPRHAQRHSRGFDAGREPLVLGR